MSRRPPAEVAHAEVVIDASPEAVHNALTDLERLRRWWADWPDCRIIAATGEARQGAAFRIDSQTKAGFDHYIMGTVLHTAPDLIALTWLTDSSSGPASNVFINLKAKGESTVVSVDHEGLTSAAEVLKMEEAWRLILRVMQRGIPHLDETRIAPEVAAYIKRRSRQRNAT